MKPTAKLALSLITIVFCAVSILGQEKKAERTLSQRYTIPDGSKIYISPMEGKLEGFIAAELVKKKLPIVVVIDETGADYIIAGTSIRGDDKWFHSVFGTGKGQE